CSSDVCSSDLLAFYESLFPGFLRDGIMFHDDPNLSGKIAHAQFVAHQTLMAAMDGGPAHQFGFSEAISFTIPCRNQEEIDYYWARLTEKGEESCCGWCKDQFGVFWKVVPAYCKS